MAKKIDVVYFVKESYSNTELAYSIRSVVKNLPYRKIWIFGGKPYNIEPDEFVEIKQHGASKWDKVKNMYRTMCENEDITEDFVLMNDDFFIMKPIKTINPMYRCSLQDHIRTLERNYSQMVGNYTFQLRNTLIRLKKAGIVEPLSYELHIPMIMNRKKLLDLLDLFPRTHGMRSIYGNYYKIGGEQMSDVKVFDKKLDFDKESTFLSSCDDIWTYKNDMRKYIEETFKEKSKYETEIDDKELVEVRCVKNYFDLELNRNMTNYSKPWLVTRERADMLKEKGLVTY